MVIGRVCKLARVGTQPLSRFFEVSLLDEQRVPRTWLGQENGNLEII